jgi:hypothetical protein
MRANLCPIHHIWAFFAEIKTFANGITTLTPVPCSDTPQDPTSAIHFDVAVTINAEAHGKAGGEISVVSSGSIGAKADAKIASTEVSRVDFNIYADFDTYNK